ncbi:hypothetical protein [Lentzea albida]|uniref:Uncharacterized protein n=1 Tax=Lentzea albida TaxID=65499 RepID=A0A1H9SEZ8_9PSEU|nr:hypothetical protein [Lentzea albida]SER82779.1 hypothetical protein SAMN04488000_112104 [Lentzea albida]
MDVKTYAVVTDLCARFAGRLDDDALNSVRVHYFAGEPALAEATLLLTLAHGDIGITREEHDLIRSTSDDPDLAAVRIIDQVPPLAYRFSPTGPADAPDPGRADQVLADEAARYGGRVLRRAWRDPLPGAPDTAKWTYLLHTDDADVLGVYAGLSGRLRVTLEEKWPLEVVHTNVSPYQAAASLAPRIWVA